MGPARISNNYECWLCWGKARDSKGERARGNLRLGGHQQTDHWGSSKLGESHSECQGDNKLDIPGVQQGQGNYKLGDSRQEGDGPISTR